MKYLIDSNIIIYSCLPEYKFISDFVIENLPSVSLISKIEVLGYSKISTKDFTKVERLFYILETVGLTEDVIDKTIQLRKKYNLKLGDSIIAASAIVHSCTLCTRNVKDFKKTKGLKLYNPFND